MKRISIDNALDVLMIIGEEDSIGLDQNEEIQKALELITLKIESMIEDGTLNRLDTLVEFH